MRLIDGDEEKESCCCQFTRREREEKDGAKRQRAFMMMKMVATVRWHRGGPRLADSKWCPRAAWQSAPVPSSCWVAQAMRREGMRIWHPT